MSAFFGKKLWNWKCPSDRELALRAKLNTGWSVHTQDGFQKREHILDPELRTIQNVIERAKIIDDQEKERIEKLVCRLQNMKRNVMGDGKNTCAMCGAPFGKLFINLPSNCVDCLKAVCKKCRIDITIYSQEVCLLCKICAENREVMKKSGGWFYGEVPAPVNCPLVLNTWEHKKHDIVRLESFEPEENYVEVPLYKNWAVCSSPDLGALDEEKDIHNNDENTRKLSESDEEFEMHLLSPPDASSSPKLSVSCPSLPEEISTPRQYKKAKSHRRVCSRRRLFTPARRAMLKNEAVKEKYRPFNKE